MIYLCGEKYLGQAAMQYAQMDPEAIVVLIKDGVYMDTTPLKGKKIFAIDEDVKRRGLGERMKAKAEMIGYDALADLVFQNKVANFA
jgi:sulfur relay protein TusB/DsrH